MIATECTQTRYMRCDAASSAFGEALLCGGVRRIKGLAGELRGWLPPLQRMTRLAPSRGERLRQNLLFAWLLAANRLGLKRKREAIVTGIYGTLAIRDHSEMLTILEVLVDGAYDSPHLPDRADLILDVGCNIGAAALWFASRYPDAKIIAVEADPATAAIAQRNLAGHANVTVVPVAVSDTPDEVTLWTAADSWDSSTVSGNGQGTKVASVTLDDLISRGGPRRLLKIDVEGAEHAVFHGATRLDDIEFITGEYHPVAGETWESFVAQLSGFNVEPGYVASDGRRTFAASRS